MELLYLKRSRGSEKKKKKKKREEMKEGMNNSKNPHEKFIERKRERESDGVLECSFGE